MNDPDSILSHQGSARPGAQGKLAYGIDELISTSCVGRSKIYEEIAAGRLKARKLSKRTLVLHGDALAWLSSLPAA